MKRVWSCLSARHICLAMAGEALLLAAAAVLQASPAASAPLAAHHAAGAEHDRPFTVRVTVGGPGATVLLTVSGLSFHEILTDGHFDVS